MLFNQCYYSTWNKGGENEGSRECHDIYWEEREGMDREKREGVEREKREGVEKEMNEWNKGKELVQWTVRGGCKKSQHNRH